MYLSFYQNYRENLLETFNHMEAGNYVIAHMLLKSGKFL